MTVCKWAGRFAVAVFVALMMGRGGAAESEAKSLSDLAWPREAVQDDGTQVTIYQPQLEKWEHNKLEARAAVAIQPKAAPQPTFGVVWLSARTEINKEDRIVTLDDVKIIKASFPAADDKGTDYSALVRKLLPHEARTVSLDRLEANLAVTQAEGAAPKAPIKNDAPQVYVSNGPGLLVLIDGKPVLRKIEGLKLLRVINTRALVLFEDASAKNYLALGKQWLQADKLEGPWTAVAEPDDALAAARKTVSAQQPLDLLDDLDPELQATFDKGKVPTVFVSTVPAELIEIDGKPQFAPIAGTQLLWVKNTENELLLDVSSQLYYVVLSGRWFRAKAVKGPWEFVPADKLPADVARIPMNHPKGDVLASVPGTPQAKELAIANEIPQTAAVKRDEAKLTPQFDGAPQFAPIEDTQLSYAPNTATPILQTAPNAYYAVENGVWFTSAAPAGPYAVAASVPPVIYTIPPSSPLYYVTFVRVYGATPDVVYMGYTPGYFGTCLAPWGCVVYGTGWRYRPWIGTHWYGRPWSYGYRAGFGWSAAGGWGFNFGAAAGHPWWGPVGWHGTSGGYHREGWEHGYGGRYSASHFSHTNFNNFNTYNRWNNKVTAHPSSGATVNKSTTVNTRSATVNNSRNTYVGSSGNVNGKNNVYAGKDGNVYRQGEKGWEQRSGANWKPADPKAGGQHQQQLDRDQWSRYSGQQHTNASNASHASGSFGGHQPARSGGGRRR